MIQKSPSKKWQSNESVSIIDQRLAAEMHLRQIESIVRAEVAGESVDEVWTRAEKEIISQVFLTNPGEVLASIDRVRNIIASAIDVSRGKLQTQFFRLGLWSHGKVVKAYAKTIPRSWWKTQGYFISQEGRVKPATEDEDAPIH